MKNIYKHVQFYVLAALYTIAYFACAILATPHALLGNLLDIGGWEAVRFSLYGLYVKWFKYDLDSLRLRVYGGERDETDALGPDVPADADQADDEPQPDYDHTEHLKHVAAAYEHTGEHKIISDED